MLNKIINVINTHNLILPNKTIFLGFSGGSDSTALLHILYTIKSKNLLGFDFDLVAIHINHSLRESAIDDQRFCENFCELNNIELRVYTKDINALKLEQKKTIEEVARDVRKNIFNSLLQDGDRLATGHNSPDNAETLLLHLIRGSGLNGLLGMNFIDDTTIRPMLSCSKEEIYHYLESNNLSYCTDETNLTTIYQRNKLRLELLPYIKENFNENIIDTLNNTMTNLRFDNDFIEQTASSEYESLSSIKTINGEKAICLNINKLSNLHPSIKNRIIIKAFTEINGSNVNLNSKNINDLSSLLEKETGKVIVLTNNIYSKKSYEDIIIYQMNESPPCCPYFEKLVPLNTLSEINNLYIYISDNLDEQNFNGYKLFKSKSFTFETEQAFYIRNMKDDDKLFLKNINGHKSLKKYFNEQKIEYLFRYEIPLLSNKDNLIMILDKKCISTDNFNMGNFSYKVQLFYKSEENYE